MVYDSMGTLGALLLYAFLLALFGSTLLLFLFLWRRGRLDFDEEATEQMMRSFEGEGQ